MARRHLHKCFWWRDREGICAVRKRWAYGLQQRSMWQPCWCCSFVRGFFGWQIGPIHREPDIGHRTWHRIALHVRRVSQFSHATANSTRRQIRNGLAPNCMGLRGAQGGLVGCAKWRLWEPSVIIAKTQQAAAVAKPRSINCIWVTNWVLWNRTQRSNPICPD